MDSAGIHPIRSEYFLPPKRDGNQTEEEQTLYRHIANVAATLPVDNDYIFPLHLYQGFWYTEPLLAGLMAYQRHFQALPTDVLLTTVPRSGTTWFKALIFSTIHRGTHHPSSPTHPLHSRNPHELVHFVDFLYAAGRIPDLVSIPHPRLLATHAPCSSLPGSVERSRCKIVHVFRNNTRANAVSQWRLQLDWLRLDEQQLPLERSVEAYMAGRMLYGPVWDVVGEYWKESRKDPERVLFLRYEEAEADTVGTLRKLAGFLGCPFSLDEEASGVPSAIAELCSFGSLSSFGVNRSGLTDLGAMEVEKKMFFTKAENRKSVGLLAPEIGERLDRLLKEKLVGHGLEV